MIEIASTEIAKPMFGVPDMSTEVVEKVDNIQKGLKQFEDPRLIVLLEMWKNFRHIKLIWLKFFTRS